MAEANYAGTQGMPKSRAIQNTSTAVASTAHSDEDEVAADVDEPPDHSRVSRSHMKRQISFKNAFEKTAPAQSERKTSLLTSAFYSPVHSPTEEYSETTALSRGLSCASTWSNTSTASMAELTSDGGCTSPGTRTSTPSPPLPSSTFASMVPIFNKTTFQGPVSINRHDDENIAPFQKAPVPESNETTVEASLGRKRCITFACGPKETSKPASETVKTVPKAAEDVEPPKRVSTIKFACPTKISSEAPAQKNKPRRPASPAPVSYRIRTAPRTTPKAHRGSDSTVRNASPITIRKQLSTVPSRGHGGNSDLTNSEAYRFHEFANSVEEVDEWLQESTCHRSRLTVNDTLKVENDLRQLGQEAEEEALEDEQDELDQEDEEEDEDMDDEEEEEEEEDGDDSYDVSDDGFQTDDEEGISDGDSDGDSDYQWWAPGGSTAATSFEHLEHIRPSRSRSSSGSSIGSVSSNAALRRRDGKAPKQKKTRPLNIREPSPELPDSTDFVCGTLDEDRPLEDAYMDNLERRRAAKHKATPQDIDPTFPASDPEMDEEDEDNSGDHTADESDQHLMMHGQMDHLDYESRGRRKEIPKKRSPAQSPKRLRSPPPAKRTMYRSPPPRRLFGQSPKRLRSPPPARLRSPPPTRRGSEILPSRRTEQMVQFVGLADRHHVTVSSSLPRTPVVAPHIEDSDNEDTSGELPTRRAIDIQVGLEQKRLRRKAQLYQKYHRKGCKDKEKRPAPGKGCEKMRDVGLGLAARGKTAGAGFAMPPVTGPKDAYILSI